MPIVKKVSLTKTDQSRIFKPKEEKKAPKLKSVKKGGLGFMTDSDGDGDDFCINLEGEDSVSILPISSLSKTIKKNKRSS